MAYERMRRRARLAMSVGGENRVGRIGPGAIRRYHGMGDPALEAALTDAGLSEEFCFATMMDLAYELPTRADGVLFEILAEILHGDDDIICGRHGSFSFRNTG